jgi:allophanate hydrolase
VPSFLIYGTFMRGQPGHANLDGGRFLDAVETAPRYRLWEVDGRWPALIEDEDGVAIAAELYDVDEPHLGRLAELEPPGWKRAPVELADGRGAEAFLGDQPLRARGRDVSAHGGWAAYVASRGRGS